MGITGVSQHHGSYVAVRTKRDDLLTWCQWCFRCKAGMDAMLDSTVEMIRSMKELTQRRGLQNQVLKPVRLDTGALAARMCEEFRGAMTRLSLGIPIHFGLVELTTYMSVSIPNSFCNTVSDVATTGVKNREAILRDIASVPIYMGLVPISRIKGSRFHTPATHDCQR